MLSFKKYIFWITVFSISMGFLESAVVVYLRELYYPNGFAFPLMPIPPKIALTEFFREAATIMMVLAVGYFCGENKITRFAWFIYSFAIWDLFYYIFLKIILNWPETVFTWDLLFLIPLPWVAPVLAPCLLSLYMILFSILLLLYANKNRSFVNLPIKEWATLITGSFICILSFCIDYLIQNSTSNPLTFNSEQHLFNTTLNYIPNNFNWFIFHIGQVLIGIIIFRYVKKLYTMKSLKN